MKFFTTKSLAFALIISLTPFLTNILYASNGFSGCTSPCDVGNGPGTGGRALMLSRTYLEAHPMISRLGEGQTTERGLKLGKRRGGTGLKSATSVSITYDDFIAHFAPGQDRQVRYVLNETGIPMDVGGENVEDLVWQMPDLDLYGTVLPRDITSESVASTPYLGDFPDESPTHAFNGNGKYDYFELFPDIDDETGALYYHGAADADYIYLAGYVHAPVPMGLGLGVFGGEVDPVDCADVGGCGTGNPAEAYYQVFQEFEEVATGTLHTYDNDATQAIKVRNTERIIVVDVDDNILEEYFIDYLLWYSKDGHYLRCELADGADWEDNTSFISIEYQKIASALPVQWRSITAELKKDRKVEVRWSTESETDNERFVVERSTDGANFLPLGELPAVGNSTGTENYRFLDEAAQEGFNYYRIKQVDFTGRSSYSTVVSALVAVSGQEEALHVLYPNPGRDEVYFSRPASYELFNTQGQRLASGQAEGSLDVADLPAGQYLVRLDGGKLHRWVKQ